MTARAVPRAPAEDGAVVAVPPLNAVAGLLGVNRRRLEDGPTLLGLPWPVLRQRARTSTLTAASVYHWSRDEAQPIDFQQPLMVAGHQPELFHPGVWVKNFALNGLARAHGLTPLNLLVDSDSVKATSLRLPAPPTNDYPWPHLVPVPFDRWSGKTPYAEWVLQEPALFADFADRAMALLDGWKMEPMLPAFWAEVRRQLERDPHPGHAFASARRAVERRWGCHNLEVPLSLVCQTEPFAWFACHLLDDLPRFHALYNGIVRAYRERHGIKSPNHPVPDLAVEEGWLEAPFWGWRTGQARRERLFARPESNGLSLRAGANRLSLPPPRADARSAVSAWQRLEREHGLKVRSRALTTTLYARLLLSDLFIHGIGGGKYDELTDELIAAFYGLTPPAFLILTATKLLPLPTTPDTVEDRRRLARLLRDVHYNPQRQGADDAALIREKQAWIERQPATKQEERERFEAIRRLSAELRGPLEEREQRLREELETCERRLGANAVLRRRDYAFCLYPEAMLRPFCTQFLS